MFRPVDILPITEENSFVFQFVSRTEDGDTYINNASEDEDGMTNAAWSEIIELNIQTVDVKELNMIVPVVSFVVNGNSDGVKTENENFYPIPLKEFREHLMVPTGSKLKVVYDSETNKDTFVHKVTFDMNKQKTLVIMSVHTRDTIIQFQVPGVKEGYAE